MWRWIERPGSRVASVLYCGAALMLALNDPLGDVAPWRIAVLVIAAPTVVAGILLRVRLPWLLPLASVLAVIGGVLGMPSLAVFSTAIRWRGARLWWLVTAVAVYSAATYVINQQPYVAPNDWLLLAAATVPWVAANAIAPALLGAFIRTRRELVALAADQVAQAHAEQDRLADLAVARERERIAGEMHDAVGHSLALLAMQAGALQVQAPTQAFAEAADQVRMTARRGLAELRAAVHALGEQTTDHAPVATLGSVPALIERSRAAGADITYEDLREDADECAPTIGRAVYVAVQEALTNAHRHAPGAPISVTLRDGPRGDLRLEVRNPLAPGGEQGAQTGLRSLATRVGLLGGTLETTIARGWFQLVVCLPSATAPRDPAVGVRPTHGGAL